MIGDKENLSHSEMLSIIVPVFNSEKYLSRCLNSLVEQTYKDLEIVLVDDGSTDSSGMICDELSRLDRRVRVIHQENKGQVAAKKTGVYSAKGEYIGFVDSDDWVEKSFCENLMDLITGTDVDMVSSGIIYDWPDGTSISKFDQGKEIVYRKTTHRREFVDGMMLPERDNYKIRPNHCTKLFRSSLLREVMENIDDRIRWHEDDCLVYSYLSRCSSFTFLHKAFYHYSQNEEACHNQKDPLFFARANYLRQSMIRNFMGSEYEENLREQLDVYFVRMLEEGVSFFGDLRASAKGYRIILKECIKDCTIVAIYGVGICGKRIIDYLLDKTDICIACIFDKSQAGEMYRGFVIQSPDNIQGAEFEQLFVTIKDNKEYKKIQKQLCEMGVPGYIIEHVYI